MAVRGLRPPTTRYRFEVTAPRSVTAGRQAILTALTGARA